MESGSHNTPTFLFTDIEGSTALWEQDPSRMQRALAAHDALCRRVVDASRGSVVKMTGDGMYAAFEDPADALSATIALQCALVDPATTHGISLRVRSGLHTGAVERRDDDFFGEAVNRAARIMNAAHGGQVLLSKAVADLVAHRLPDRAALLDVGLVRLRGLVNPEHVYQLVHADLRQRFPALRSLETTPNNLPQQVTSFIGRERQLSETKTLLGNARLLTLLGVGGLGKSRLSIQVGADVIDDYPDGVWLVELAGVADGQLVSQAVASALGVTEEPGRPVQEALEKHVKERQLLLILDNCEHLLSACATLVRALLQCAPRLKVLASSREPLREAGEASYQVAPLSVPDAETEPSLAAAMQYESVRLFCDRAAATQPGFQATQQNAAAIAAICHRLDGIPLAIELAAARVRGIPVATIAERLVDRFRMLTVGSRTALPRQQTLRACIDWSYNLLSPRERTLLRRLPVFAGGFSLEAAEAIGGGGDIEQSDVLDLLAQLVDKSLVELAVEGQRYRLLETVRQYAQELLDASDEANAVRTRHLKYYMALVDAAEAHLRGPEQGAWLARLDIERENLLSAHAWCGAVDDGPEWDVQFVSEVHLYWMRRGLLRLGYRVTVEALARPGTHKPTVARCRALYAAGNLGHSMARFEEAQTYVEESLAIARELCNKGRIAAALVLLGTILGERGDRANARRYYEESLVLSEELGDSLLLANVLGSLAVLHGADGDYDVAETLFERSLSLSRKHGNPSNIAANLCNLAIVSIHRNVVDRARASLVEALTIAREIGAKSLGLSILSISAMAAAAAREWQRAARWHGASRAESGRRGIVNEVEDEALLSLMAQAREALGEGPYAAAEGEGRQLGFDAALAEIRAWLAAT